MGGSDYPASIFSGTRVRRVASPALVCLRLVRFIAARISRLISRASGRDRASVRPLLTWIVTAKTEHIPSFFTDDTRLQTQFGTQVNLMLWLGHRRNGRCVEAI